MLDNGEEDMIVSQEKRTQLQDWYLTVIHLTQE